MGFVRTLDYVDQVSMGRPQGGASTFYTVPGPYVVRGSGNHLITQNVITYTPVVISQSLTVVNIVGEVVSFTGEGREAAVALYEATPSLQPRARIAEGRLDASGAGVKTVAVNRRLSPGRYLIARNANTSSTGWRSFYLQGSFFALGSTNYWNALSVASSYGTPPDPGLEWDTYTSSTAIHRGSIWLEVEA